MLNVSSRVFWLELDDKALLQSYEVLQEGILCDVYWKAHSCYHAARPSRCGWLTQFHVIAKEPMTYLYNPEYSH